MRTWPRTFVKAFVKWFCAELDRRGMSQEEAARAFGVPLSSVSRWATGRTLPSYAHLVRIKRVWGSLPPPARLAWTDPPIGLWAGRGTTLDADIGTAYEPTMEIKEHPDGRQVSGPFGPSDAANLIDDIRENDVVKLHCANLSSEDAHALADLLQGIQPWLEEEDRKLSLILQGSGDSWVMFAQRLDWKGSRIEFVGVGRIPEPG
jgi:transcriptional regulator with XRE-family HTH domain